MLPRRLRPLWIAVTLAALVECAAAVDVAARDLYVAPNGLPTNPGTFTAPLDLTTALAIYTPARPGDTIWMLNGTYLGPFSSWLTGTAAQPITLRPYPGARATIDGGAAPTLTTFYVQGEYAIYRGFEITNSGLQRIASDTGRGTSLDIFGPHTKFINLVVHDGETGVAFWSTAIDSELYGTIIANSGSEWTDRGHGHSIYVQNDTGTKRLVDNILFNAFSFGIHAYTQQGRVDNLVMDGNISFNNGILSAVSGAKTDILLGGLQAARNAVVTNNYLYYTPGTRGGGASLGYLTACSNPTVRGNYFVSAEPPVTINCTGADVRGNVIYGNVDSSIPTSYPNNIYYPATPSSAWVFIRPNQYEAGRANIVVYNWPLQPQVPVDLWQAGLAPGDGFEIRDAQNFFGPAIATGTFNGSPIQLPMTGLVAAAPIGNAPITPPHTAPGFGAFVVLRTSTLGAPSATLSASPSATQSGQTATLSWSASNATSVILTPGGPVASSGAIDVNPTTTTTYTLTASNASGAFAIASTTVHVTVPTAGTASFIGTDLTTLGNWKGVYGGQGYALAQETANFPAYLQGGIIGQDAGTWEANPTDARALQRGADPANRVAAAWYAPTSFLLDLNLTDGATHRVALYVVDYDNFGRAQTVEVRDWATNALLDSRSVTSFRNGRYLAWRLSGHVTIRVIKTASYNGVVSGVFFDAQGSNAAPTVSMANPVAAASFASGLTIPLAATASDSDGAVAQVRFYDGTALIGTSPSTGSPFTFNWTGATIGTHQVTARATDDLGLTTPSAPVAVTVSVAPVVSMDTPTGGPFTAPAVVPLSATASDSDGIAQVSFYRGGTTFIGTSTSTSSPYGFSWSGVAAGSYQVTARATDNAGVTTISAPLTVVVQPGATPPGGSTTVQPTSASFMRVDVATQGNWKGTYGSQGFALANDAASWPSYAQVAFSGQAANSWAVGTPDVRALQQNANPATRTAAAWYSASSFTIDLNLTDGLPHQLALYALDWDHFNRVESVEFRDAVTGIVLDTRTLSAFDNGQYWLWQLSGHVIVTVTRTASFNGVISGLFLDPIAPSPSAPAISLTSPAPATPFFAPTSINFGATASDADGIAQVIFYAGPAIIGTGKLVGGIYTSTWNNVGSGTYQVTAWAFDTTGTGTVSAPLTVKVTGSGGGSEPTAATFVRTDGVTQGNWKNVYGTQGYAIVNDATSLPSYAQMTVTGQSAATWTASTTDVRALQQVTNPIDRIAAAWYAAGSFTIDLNLTDGLAHQVALYAIDWDRFNRAETIEIRDPVTGVLLDSQSLTIFSGGQYWVWRISGHVTIRITRTASYNGVVSALFLDPSGVTNVAPTVSMTAPAAPFVTPGPVPLSATASDTDGTITQVSFYHSNTTFIGTSTSTSSPYTFSWTNVPTGTYQVIARATDSSSVTTTSDPVTVSVTAPTTPPGGGTTPPGGGTTPPGTRPTSASFMRTDTATKGNWKGTYGSQGFALANDAASWPAYAEVALSGQALGTWATGTSDVRALQQNANPATRTAAAWYSTTSFTVDLNLTDGASHRLALYAIDWDHFNRAETIEIRDAVTGIVLDTRSLSAFDNGQYWLWQLSGHVILTITRTASFNSVVSGLFLDPITPSATPLVTLTSPAPATPFVAPTTVSLAATASDADGIAQVIFYAGPAIIGTGKLVGGVFTATWNNVGSGTYQVTAWTFDTTGTGGVSAPLAVQVTGSGGGSEPTAATFLRTDTATQGNWKGVYGTQGYSLVNDATSLPAYAQLALTGQSAATWTGSTPDGRALQQVTDPTDRIAAAWYSAGSFTFDLNLTDGLAHQIAIYAIDWDHFNRAETIEIRDPVTGLLLNSQSLANFSNGQYWVWRVSGHVTIRVTRTASYNGVASAIFLDPVVP